MVTLYVSEMSCSHCTGRIGALLDRMQIPHKIYLEEKKVEVDVYDNQLKEIISELDDIGFTATVQ